MREEPPASPETRLTQLGALLGVARSAGWALDKDRDELIPGLL